MVYRPIANLLFLGPTGSGKTRLVECFAEYLFGTAKGVLKIDCAEFQHGHEVAKLISAPPGYLGHSSTPPRLSQEALDKYISNDHEKPSLLLFDEIEKAHDEFYQLLLGILDKGTIVLGNNTKTDFTNTIIIFTSNLGSIEVQKVLTNSHVGFSPITITEDIDERIKNVANKELGKRFSPEFINRIDKTIVFKSLSDESLSKILEIELSRLEDRILSSGNLIILKVTDDAKDFLKKEGTSFAYGARELIRVIEKHLVFPISNLISTKQVSSSDLLVADYTEDRIIFRVLKNAIPPAPDIEE